MLVSCQNDKGDISKENEPLPEQFIDHRTTTTQTNNNKQNNSENQPKIIQLNNQIIKNNDIVNNKKAQNIKKSNSFRPNNKSKKINYSKEKLNTNYISTNNNTSKNNNNINNNSKVRATLPNYDNSKFDKYNIQQIYYNIQKDYSYLHINKDEHFLNRMQFDIYKRQLKEDRVNKLVEINKIKIDEDEKIKVFNRLIKDANRRLEAKENSEKAQKNPGNDTEDVASGKKYNEKEWKEIYNKRFKNYEENINKKREENKKNNLIQKINKENEQISLCHTKKASKKYIEESVQRMYDEAKKRKIKMNEKMIRLNNNYEDDPSKYVKKIKSQSYSFLDDNDCNIYNLNQINSIESNDYYIGNNKNKENNVKKKKGMAVSEFNNKRFDKKIRGGGSSPFIKCNDENLNEFFFNNNPSKNINNENNRNMNYNYDKNYNLEEEREKLIQMANIKNLQKDNRNDGRNTDKLLSKINTLNINKEIIEKDKKTQILGKDINILEVDNLIDQFIFNNLNSS